MQLVFLEQYPRYGGGSERVSFDLCRYAIENGHGVWLVHDEDGDLVPAYAAAGATCWRRPVRPLAVRRPLEALRSIASLVSVVRRARADVIFTSQVSYVSLLAATTRLHGARTVVHLGLTYDYESPLFKAGMKAISRGITPSRHTADGWLARSWPAASLQVIPNGVDIATFSKGTGRDTARRALRYEVGPLLIAYVGRLVREKGIFTLLRAFAELRAGGSDARLTFVGNAPGGEVTELRSLGGELKLPEHSWSARSATTTPEMVYRAADIVVVPSEWDEPFGLVPIEAAACGTLVVTSNRGMLPELLGPVVQTAVFPAGDAHALAARLRHWLGADREREMAADALSAHVRTKYDFAGVGKAYLAECARLIQ